jgi:hypothetical protein
MAGIAVAETLARMGDRGQKCLSAACRGAGQLTRRGLVSNVQSRPLMLHLPEHCCACIARILDSRARYLL